MLRTPNLGRASLIDVQFERVEEYDYTIFSEADIKLFARVNNDLEDVLISDIIDEVSDLAQTELNTSFQPRKVTATFESFASETKIPYGPVLDILSISRLDKDEEEEIEGWYRRGDLLYFDTVYGYDSPYYRQGLEVEYLAGYLQIPAGIKNGLRQAITTSLEDREDNVLGSVSEIPSNSRRKLLKFRRY
jgi:hypothetical protein